MMNYNRRVHISILSQGQQRGLRHVCLEWQLTFLVCFWALPDFFYIMTFSISLLHFWVFFFFLSGGGANSLPQHSLISPNGKRSRRARESTSAYSKATSQMSFQAIHTVMGAIVDIGGVFGEWT